MTKAKTDVIYLHCGILQYKHFLCKHFLFTNFTFFKVKIVLCVYFWQNLKFVLGNVSIIQLFSEKPGFFSPLICI